MDTTDLDNVDLTTPEKVVYAYRETKEKFKNAPVYDAHTLSRTEANEKLKSYQSYYNLFMKFSEMLSEFNYDAKVKNSKGVEIPITNYINSINLYADRAQFGHLYPLTLRLSQLAESDSISRDEVNHSRAIMISWFAASLSLLASALIGFYFDRNVDPMTNIEINELAKMDSIISKVYEVKIYKEIDTLDQKIDSLNFKIDLLSRKFKKDSSVNKKQ